MNVSVGTHPFDILGLPCIDFQWMLLFSVYVITSLAKCKTLSFTLPSFYLISVLLRDNQV